VWNEDMNLSDIAYLRLHNQFLTEPRFQKLKDVVEWLWAVQAQDYAAAKWALWLRMQHVTDGIMEKSFDKGRFCAPMSCVRHGISSSQRKSDGYLN
jgi:hypothetical protein